MTGYIIDGVVILILLIGAVIGMKKGFIESVLSLITTGASFVVSVIFAKDITVFVCQYVDIQTWILNYINSTIEKSGEPFNILGITDPNEAASILTVVIVGILTFIAIKLAVAIIIKICNSLSNYSPTFNGINKLLGFVFGAVKSAVFVCLLLVVCHFLEGIPGIGTTILDYINQTYITSFAYTYVVMFVQEYCTAEYISQLIDQVQAVL